MGYKSFYNRKVKRGLDVLVSVPLLLVTAPFLIVISAAILLDDGFPVFYRPLRGGYKNRPFHIYKFRTMVKNADKLGGPTTALNDRRITRLGRVLRKLKLDELPQLFNVLKGEMSIVGPRPEVLQYTDLYRGKEKRIFEVRPGITDYSSIQFISLDEIVGESNVDEYYEQHILHKKNRLRVKYADTVSFPTDCRIFLLTVKKLLEKVNRILREREKEKDGKKWNI